MSEVDEILSQITDIPAVIAYLGMQRSQIEGKHYTSCLLCSGKQCLFYISPKNTIMWHCTSCRKSGNILHILSYKYNLDIRQGFPRILRRARFLIEGVASLVEERSRFLDVLHLNATHPKTGFVYFIQAESGGPVKIGWSTQPRSRISSLQTGNPQKLRIVLSVPANKMTERSLHAHLSAYRTNGEWFDLQPPVLAVMDTLRLLEKPTKLPKTTDPCS